MKDNFDDKSNAAYPSLHKTIIQTRAEIPAIQCQLDKRGASDLVVELIIRNPSNAIFSKSVELGNALLEGGNETIQKSIYLKLTEGNNSEKFFKVIHNKMVSAQKEIKNSLSINAADLTRVKNLNSLANADSGGINLDPSSASRAKFHNRNKNRLVLTEEVKKQLCDAASVTASAFNTVKSLVSTSASSFLSFLPYNQEDLDISNAEIYSTSDVYDSSSNCEFQSWYSDLDEHKLLPEVEIMEPILRFLQLLCENHNKELQDYLRNQSNKTNYNLVSETLRFLDCICGSTPGGLGLVGLYINEKNVPLVNQTLKTLTEYCQGPCHDNQTCIAIHESNGIDIINALILNDINPLEDKIMDLVLELKNNASKLLLAIMESRADSENAERIMFNMSPEALIKVSCNAFHKSKSYVEEMNVLKVEGSFSGYEVSSDFEQDDNEISPKEVGHNIYILCHQLSRHNKELANLLKQYSTNPSKNNKKFEALNYYASHTAQIEIVRADRTMEQIVFPVPQICEYLTPESKMKVYYQTQRDEQGSKVSDFFKKTFDLYDEMEWQKKLRGQQQLYWVSRHMSTWGSISFNLAVFINLIVAFFYPFSSNSNSSLDPRLSAALWAVNIISLICVLTLPRRPGVRWLVASVMLRLIYLIGIKHILWLMGTANIVITTVHLISIMGNHGTFTKPLLQILVDFEFIYHVIYLIVCAAGLCMHPLFYSILLLNVVYQEETLKNVIRSVTRNGRSIIMTALLAVILIYLFSIIGYLFFRDDFLLEVEEPSSYDSHFNTTFTSESANLDKFANCTTENFTLCEDKRSNKSSVLLDIFKENMSQSYQKEKEKEDKERSCDSLIMCIITTLNQGLRNGGGIGDVLRSPSLKENLFVARVVYDILFYFIINIIILNLIFGVIIDTFADLRSEKQQKEEILKNTCFICGLERSAFDNRSVSFEEHIKHEHNLWHYLFFIVLVRVKNPTEFTGPESYVAHMINEKNLDWFPRMRALSLDNNEGDNEQNEVRTFQDEIRKFMANMNQQIREIQEQVSTDYHKYT